MSNFKTVSEFVQWESSEFGKLNWVRDRVSALIGLPTLLAAGSFGAAQGGAIGAAYSGIGIISGAVLGGLIGGTIFFMLAAVFAIWAFPALITMGLKLSRRITEGDFNYRYLKHLARSEAEMEYDKLIEIAKTYHKMVQYRLIRDTSRDHDGVIEDLFTSQVHVFRIALGLILKHPNPELALKSNKQLSKLKKNLIQEKLVCLRGNKRWAREVLKQQEQNTPQDIELARVVLNTVSEGRKPFKFFSTLPPQQPIHPEPQKTQRLKERPYVLIVDQNRMVKDLLELDIDSIKEIPTRVCQEVEYYLKRPESEVQSEYDLLGDKSYEMHKEFLGSVLKRIRDFKSTKLDYTDSTRERFLRQYQAILRLKLHANRNNIYKSRNNRFKLAQIGHELSKSQPDCSINT